MYDDCVDDVLEKDVVLVDVGNFEVGEDEDEYEDVVYV